MAMDINEPIFDRNEYMFCEEGNQIAHDFLEASRDAVKRAGVGDPLEISERVLQQLDLLLAHRHICPSCNEE